MKPIFEYDGGVSLIKFAAVLMLRCSFSTLSNKMMSYPSTGKNPTINRIMNTMPSMPPFSRKQFIMSSGVRQKKQVRSRLRRTPLPLTQAISFDLRAPDRITALNVSGMLIGASYLMAAKQQQMRKELKTPLQKLLSAFEESSRNRGGLVIFCLIQTKGLHKKVESKVFPRFLKYQQENRLHLLQVDQVRTRIKLKIYTQIWNLDRINLNGTHQNKDNIEQNRHPGYDDLKATSINVSIFFNLLNSNNRNSIHEPIQGLLQHSGFSLYKSPQQDAVRRSINGQNLITLSHLLLVLSQVLLGEYGFSISNNRKQILDIDLAEVSGLHLLELAALQLADGPHAGLRNDVPDLGGGEVLEAVDDLGEVALREVVTDVLQVAQQQLAAGVGVGVGQEDQLAEPPLGRRVQLLRQVGRPDHQHLAALGRVHPVHQHQELRLQPPRRVVLVLRTRRQHRVDLVDEDYRRRQLLRPQENALQRLLTLPHQLVQDGTGRQRQERTARLLRQRTADVGLPVPRRTVQQDASGRRTNTRVEVRSLAWANDGLFEGGLDVGQSHDVLEGHVQVPDECVLDHGVVDLFGLEVAEDGLLALGLHHLDVNLIGAGLFGAEERPIAEGGGGVGEAEADGFATLLHLLLGARLGVGLEGLELGDLVAQLLDGLLGVSLAHQLPQQGVYLVVATDRVLVVTLPQEILSLRGQRLRLRELLHYYYTPAPNDPPRDPETVRVGRWRGLGKEGSRERMVGFKSQMGEVRL